MTNNRPMGMSHPNFVLSQRSVRIYMLCNDDNILMHPLCGRLQLPDDDIMQRL